MGTKFKIKKYIEQWEKRGYPDGIPDEVPIQLEKLDIVPSYRKICIALMRNENNLESLGFTREKCISYSNIKRAELGNINKNKQLKLNL